MRRLVILRPEPGATATVERAAAIGLEAVAMPLFEVAAVPWEAPDARNFHALVLTSANAVRHGGPGLDALRGLPAYAVGEATAAAAREAGLEVAGCGEAGIERLLAAVPPGLRLLHLCGEHRAGPETQPAITAVPVYRSTELPPAAAFGEICGEVVAVHSPRAGQRLAELAERFGIDRRTVAIAAISEAAASAAGAGWEQCEFARRPDEAALLALAARLCDNRSKT